VIDHCTYFIFRQTFLSDTEEEIVDKKSAAEKKKNKKRRENNGYVFFRVAIYFAPFFWLTVVALTLLGTDN
jgi:hypothetical protein